MSRVAKWVTLLGVVLTVPTWWLLVAFGQHLHTCDQVEDLVHEMAGPVAVSSSAVALAIIAWLYPPGWSRRPAMVAWWLVALGGTAPAIWWLGRMTIRAAARPTKGTYYLDEALIALFLLSPMATSIVASLGLRSSKRDAARSVEK